jgi:hypothetical protein
MAKKRQNQYKTITPKLRSKWLAPSYSAGRDGHICGYGEEAYELKEQFLKDGYYFFRAVAEALATVGYTEARISKNRAGMAVSGDVTARFRKPGEQGGIYADFANFGGMTDICYNPQQRQDNLRIMARSYETLPSGSERTGPNRWIAISDSLTLAKQLLAGVGGDWVARDELEQRIEELNTKSSRKKRTRNKKKQQAEPQAPPAPAVEQRSMFGDDGALAPDLASQDTPDTKTADPADRPQPGDVVDDPGSIWDGAEVISVYTREDLENDHNAVSVVRVGDAQYTEARTLRNLRQQGIENTTDGQFVHLDIWGAQSGLPAVPVLLDRQVWADVQDIPKRLEGLADIKGRLWDVVAGAGLRAQILARQQRTIRDDHDPTQWGAIPYQIELPIKRHRRKTYFLRAVYDRDAPFILITQDEHREAEAERQATTRRVMRQIQRDAQRAVDARRAEQEAAV